MREGREARREQRADMGETAMMGIIREADVRIQAVRPGWVAGNLGRRPELRQIAVEPAVEAAEGDLTGRLTGLAAGRPEAAGVMAEAEAEAEPMVMAMWLFQALRMEERAEVEAQQELLRVVEEGVAGTMMVITQPGPTGEMPAVPGQMVVRAVRGRQARGAK